MPYAYTCSGSFAIKHKTESMWSTNICECGGGSQSKLPLFRRRLFVRLKANVISDTQQEPSEHPTDCIEAVKTFKIKKLKSQAGLWCILFAVIIKKKGAYVQNESLWWQMMRLHKTLKSIRGWEWGTPASLALTQRYYDFETTENSVSDGRGKAVFPSSRWLFALSMGQKKTAFDSDLQWQC